jgi:hypothetical protein
MHNWYHSNVSSILYTHGHRLQCITIHGAFPLLLSPLADSPLPPFCSPFNPFYLLGTLLAVTGSVHLGLRLLANWPPLSQPSPLQIPRTPVTQRLTKTTSGRIRRLLSGKVTVSAEIGFHVRFLKKFNRFVTKDCLWFLNLFKSWFLRYLRINLEQLLWKSF